MPREDAERSLDFYGFLVLHNPMKQESAPVLAALREASHALVMITGDQMLTACHAAKELALVTKPALILEFADEGKAEGKAEEKAESARALEWRWLQAQEGAELAPRAAELTTKSFKALASSHDLCIAGHVFAHLVQLGR